MGVPLADLVLHCRDVELRPVREADLAPLADRLPDDVRQDPAQAHWPGQDDAANRRRIFVQGIWRSAGSWSPEEWELPLAVRHRGELVGVQTLEATDFARLRTVDSASWLIPSARGRGFGVAARTAVLGLAFDHLHAGVAVSSATLDNPASLGVSRRLGYRDDGIGRVVETDRVADLQHLRLDRDDWRRGGLGAEVEVGGIAGCRWWFGVGGDRSAITARLL